MQEVTLQQMLEARENRVLRQQRLLAEYRCPLVCFSMNIPGPVKDSPLIRRAFRQGCTALEARLKGIVHREALQGVTGCEAMYAVEGNAREIKAVCTAIEEETALGRLFDMDVLDPEGNKLDRSLVGGGSRDCIVCGAPGRGCASRRLHSVARLQAAVREILEDHFARQDRETIGMLAVQSLLEEVRTTPKPGLVDCRNSGSHGDMDIATFTASAEALGPYFRECVEIGRETGDQPCGQTFFALRRAGIAAEETMYRATGGVNTHKGAIFTMGLLCGSLGRLWKPEAPVAEMEQVLEECARMAAIPLKEDFSQEPATAGGYLHRQLGLTGIRGEAAAGLPSVAKGALPVFREQLARGRSVNDAGVITLLHLIATVEDTNLYHRGGPEGAAWAKEQAAALLPSPAMAQVEQLDDAFIRRRLSPGGCADLLAATYFLEALYKKTSTD